MSDRFVRNVLVVGLMLGVARSLDAQQRETRIGAIVGFNFAKLSGELSDADSRSGFMLGGFASFRLNRNFAIEPEVVYTQRGAAQTVAGVKATFKLDYVEVPVLLKILFPLANNPSTRPHLLFGPAVAFKVGCKLSGSAGGIGSVSFDCSEADQVVELNGTDFGLVGGAGLDVRDFSFGIRYLLGLTKIDASILPSTAKHRVLTFFASYGFRVGK